MVGIRRQEAGSHQVVRREAVGIRREADPGDREAVGNRRAVRRREAGSHQEVEVVGYLRGHLMKVGPLLEVS